MKLKLFFAALVGGLFCTSVHAQDSVSLSLSGTITGTTTTYSCEPYELSCTASDPFTQAFDLQLQIEQSALLDGHESFSYGNPYSDFGLFSGTIRREGDAYFGDEITFSRADPTIRYCGISCFGSTASGGAASFEVSSAAPVPEPSTWAMMLLGFGAVGYGVRRRRQRGLVPQIS